MWINPLRLRRGTVLQASRPRHSRRNRKSFFRSFGWNRHL